MEKRTKVFGYNGWILWLGIALVLSLFFANVPGSPGMRGGFGVFFIIGFIILYAMDKKEEKAAQTVSPVPAK